MKRKERWQVDFLEPIEETVRKLHNRRVYILELAAKIEAGQSLSELERVMAAGTLRAAAEQIPTVPPRKRGQAPQIDAGAVALEFVGLVKRGRSKSAARAELATRWGVTVEAIRKALKKYGRDAERMVEFFDNLNRK